MKLLTLLSGGIGSLVATKIMLDEHDVEELYCLFVNYGQKAFALEKQCAKKHAELLGAKQFVSINTAPLRGGTAVLDSGYTNDDCHECVPFLFEHLLTIAANYATSWGCGGVCAGWDRSINISDIIWDGPTFWEPLWVHSPEWALRKGTELGVAPLIETWSCVAPQLVLPVKAKRLGSLFYKPCGKCDKCMDRARAFSALDLEDPLIRLEITKDSGG